MAKEWWEETPEEFADDFTEERRVHHTPPNDQELAAVYGPAATYSEHKRGGRVTYIDASGQRQSGVIEWVQAAHGDIQQKYIIAPDEPGAFLDFALPGDILQS